MNLAYDFVNLRTLQQAEEERLAESSASANDDGTQAAVEASIEEPSINFEHIAEELSQIAKAQAIETGEGVPDLDTYIADHLQIDTSYRLLEPVSRNPYRLSRKQA